MLRLRRPLFGVDQGARVGAFIAVTFFKIMRVVEKLGIREPDCQRVRVWVGRECDSTMGKL